MLSQSALLGLLFGSCSAFTAAPAAPRAVATGRSNTVVMRNYWGKTNDIVTARKEAEDEYLRLKAEAQKEAWFAQNPGDKKASKYVDAYRQAQYPFTSLTQRCACFVKSGITYTLTVIIPCNHCACQAPCRVGPDGRLPQWRPVRRKSRTLQRSPLLSHTLRGRNWGSKPQRTPDMPILEEAKGE